MKVPMERAWAALAAAAIAGVAAAVGCSATAGPAPEPGAAVLELTLRADLPRQVIHGFGASDAWSIQFVGRDWPLEKRQRIAGLLFSRAVASDGSPRGIGLSSWRFNLGAGSALQGDDSGIRDPWRRAESFLLPDGSYDWSLQAGQRWFLRAAKEHGVEEFVGFVNSPPVALTRNGRAFSSGGESANLAPERYPEFAAYLRDVVAELERREGVRLDIVSPVNEPQWDWDGGQEGSPWLNQEVHDLVEVIGRTFRDAGLETRIEVPEAGKLNYLYEEADRPRRGAQAEAFFSAESPQYIGDVANVARTVAGHSYFTTHGTDRLVEVRSRLRERLDALDPALELRMSEYCVLEDNPEIRGRGRDLGMHTALYVARVIHADLVVAGASSWSWWLAVSPYDYKDGLVYIDRGTGDGEIYPSKLLWTLGNFSRFVRPGMRRIEVQRSDGLSPAEAIEGVLASAYVRPETGETVAVLVNQGSSEARIRVRGAALDRFRVYRTSAAAGDDLRHLGRHDAGDALVIPARSVVTLVSD